MIDLSSTTEPRLQFMTYWAIEDVFIETPPGGYNGWDGCNVWISNNGGSSFSVINPIDPGYSVTSLVSFGQEDHYQVRSAAFSATHLG